MLKGFLPSHQLSTIAPMTQPPLQKPIPGWCKLSALVLLGTYLLFFNKLVTGKQVMFHEDIMLISAPLKHYIANQLKQGVVPLWNPYSGAGSPLLAEALGGVFYPLNVLYLLLPLALAVNYFIIVHFVLAGLFMYLFCRSLQIQTIPSLTGSIIFSLGAFFVCHVNHIDILSAGIWLPLFFYLIERWRRSRQTLFLLWLVPVFAIQLLGGHPQVVFYSIAATTAYFLYRSLFPLKELQQRWFTPFLLWFLVLGFAACLASLQLISTYELKEFTVRASPRPGFSTELSFPPWHFFTYVVPNLFGHSRASFFPTKFWYQDFYRFKVSYWETASYVGILPFLLTAAAFFVPLKRPATFFRVMLLVSFISMLGRFTPIYTFLATIPPINAFRVPARFIYLATFCFAVLTAMCVDSMTSQDRQLPLRRVLLACLVVCILLIGALAIFSFQSGRIGEGLTTRIIEFYSHYFSYWAPGPFMSKLSPKEFSSHFSRNLNQAISFSNPSLFMPGIFLAASALLLIGTRFLNVKREIFQGLAFLLVAIDLFSFGYSYNIPASAKLALSEPRVAKLFKGEKSAYRIFVLPFRAREVDQKEMLIPNSNLLWGVRSFAYYSPLRLRRMSNYTKALIRDVIQGRTGLMAYANIKYVITKIPLPIGRLDKFAERNGIQVYRNRQVLPRAFITSEVKLANSPGEALFALRENGRKAHALGIVESYKDRFPTTLNPSPEGSIEFVSESTRKIRLRVQVSDDALLVFNENYYPGWNAFIDGARTSIYRTNYLFQGIVVPGGTHTVEFQFRPFSFRIGAWISGISFIAFFVLSTLLFIKRKPTP